MTRDMAPQGDTFDDKAPEEMVKVSAILILALAAAMLVLEREKALRNGNRSSCSSW